MICSPKTSKCIHKNVLPLKEREIYGTIVLTIFIAMAVMSGIGGGGIIIIVLMHFFILGTKESIAINYFAIFAGSITRFVVTF